MRIPAFVMSMKAEIREQGVNGRGEPFDKLVFSSPCRIEPQSQQIKRMDGTIVTTSGFGTFPLEADLEEGQKITCDGYTYEVLSVKPIPSFTGYSHKEVQLG